MPARGVPSSDTGLSPGPTSAAARQRPGRLGTREGGPEPTAKFPAAESGVPAEGAKVPAAREQAQPRAPAASRRAEGGPPGHGAPGHGERKEARALTLPPTSRGRPGEASRRDCHDEKATLRAYDPGHLSPAKPGAPAPKAGGRPADRRPPRDGPRLRPAPPRPRTPPAPARSRAFAPPWWAGGNRKCA